MSIIYPPVIDQIFFDNEGNVLANGFVRAFYHGTTIEAPTYNRNDEPNLNPIELNASGRAQFKLNTGIAYDIQTFDSSDALIETFENVRPQSGGGGDAQFDLTGTGLEIVGDEPNRTLQITSAYDAGLVHTTGDESIGGIKTFTDGIKPSFVETSFNFTTLQPNQGALLQSVKDSSGSGDQISLGVLANASGETNVAVNAIQRGAAGQIMMNNNGRFGQPLGDDSAIDPFVLQSEAQNNLKTYVETTQDNGLIEVNLSSGDGLFVNASLSDQLFVEFVDDVVLKDYTLFIALMGSSVEITKTGVTFYNGSTSSLDTFTISATNAATEIVLKFVSSTACFVSVNT